MRYIAHAITVLFILITLTVGFASTAAAQVNPFIGEDPEALIEEINLEPLGQLTEEELLGFYQRLEIYDQRMQYVIERGEMFDPNDDRDRRAAEEAIPLALSMLRIFEEMDRRFPGTAEFVDQGFILQINISVLYYRLGDCAMALRYLQRLVDQEDVYLYPRTMAEAERVTEMIGAVCEQADEPQPEGEVPPEEEIREVIPPHQEFALPPQPVQRSLAAPLTIGAVGIGVMTTGLVLELSARDSVAEYNQLLGGCETSGCDTSTLADLANTAQRNHTLGTVGLITGGIALATGGTWAIVRARRNGAESGVSVQPTANFGRGGASVGLGVRW